MRALLVANGPAEDLAFIVAAAHTFDLVIVTDGAVHSLPETVKVSVICGDFDSIDRGRVHTTHSEAEFMHLPDQEAADIEKALHIARERGAREITIVGAFGGRIDHSLVTISVMLRYHGELDIVLLHGGATSRILSPQTKGANPCTIETTAGDIISIVPLSRDAVVTAENVQWPLVAERLTSGSRGVSNRATGGRISVEVTEGVAMLCHTPAFPHGAS